MQESLRPPLACKAPAARWVNYYLPVSMTCFAAAVRAGPAQQSLATVKRKTIVMQDVVGSHQQHMSLCLGGTWHSRDSSMHCLAAHT